MILKRVTDKGNNIMASTLFYNSGVRYDLRPQKARIYFQSEPKEDYYYYYFIIVIESLNYWTKEGHSIATLELERCSQVAN